MCNDQKPDSNLKDLYKRYCDCRDQEIDRFWKHSVYLWTFLAICFTGYGFLLNSYLGKDVTPKLEAFFPLISSIICCFGIVLSYLWCRMAKALKTTFESFEMATWEIECFHNVFDCDNKHLIHNYWTTKDNDRPSSPTRIAVVLGYISIVFWGVVLCMGIYIGYEPTILNIISNISLILHCNNDSIEHANCITYSDILQYVAVYAFCIMFFVCVIILLCMFVISKILKRFVKSDRVRTKEENDVFKSIRRIMYNDLYVNKLSEIPYFEITNNEVCFIFKNNEQYLYGKQKLVPYFQDAFIKDDDAQLKIHFNYSLIKEPHCELKREGEQLEELINKRGNINVEVHIYNRVICVSFKGNDYKDDMNVLTEILDELIKEKEQYTDYHISYKFNCNKDENKDN